MSARRSKAVKPLEDFVLSPESPWEIQEAYNALRTNIVFSLPGMTGKSKVIGVTSANPGEGKSTNCINTAVAFAEVGKRVLVIDADMRRPSVAASVGLKMENGLSSVLVGECKIIDAIVHSDSMGLDILSAGKIPPNATKLIQSHQMELLIQALRKSYEYIFVDLPPITTVADAAIMAPLTDGFLVVVRHASTATNEVADMISELNFAGANILGFIYNGTDTSKKGGHYSNYYYYSSN